MKIPLTRARKWLAAATAVLLALLYLGLASSQYVAYWLGNPSRLELSSLPRLRRAAWLDPGDADYRNRLGRFYDLVSRDPASAVAQYKAAVVLNPHSAEYWLNLADAYQVMDDTANQTAALERSIQAEPTNPDVARTAANFYLVLATNEKDPAVAQSLTTKALREFRVVLANDPPSATEAIKNCWRLEPDVDILLRDVVPPRSEAYTAFLTLLQQDASRLLRELTSPPANADAASPAQQQDKLAQMKKETAASFKVWNALIESRQPFEERYPYDYIRFLVQMKEVDQATLVWQQAVDQFKLSSYLSSPGNLIVNGKFSLRLLNAGFDWQYQKQTGVNLTLQPLDPKNPDGSRSLLIAFDGPGISDAGIYQFVPVEPNTTYEFSAHYKNEGELEGAGGPHFTVQDVYSQAIYYESDVLKPANESNDDGELDDSNSRKLVQGEFTTAPDGKLVVVHLRRLPERSPIRGKLWIDGFRLIKKPS
jgi:tetratricopeptide (TPR) repeat protein